MARLAQLPPDTIFFTQITMEAAEDPDFLDAMHAAHIKGALVGVESVTPEGLKDVYKEFNAAGAELVERLRTFRRHGVYVLGSFIFGLPSDRPETFDATAARRRRGRSRLRPVRDFDALSRYRGLHALGKGDGGFACPYRRHSHHPALAHSASSPAQTLLASSHHVRPKKFAAAPNPSGTPSTA